MFSNIDQTNTSKDYIYAYLVNLTYNLVRYIQLCHSQDTVVMDQGSSSSMTEERPALKHWKRISCPLIGH